MDKTQLDYGFDRAFAAVYIGIAAHCVMWVVLQVVAGKPEMEARWWAAVIGVVVALFIQAMIPAKPVGPWPPPKEEVVAEPKPKMRVLQRARPGQAGAQDTK